jgi:VanZ family protein
MNKRRVLLAGDLLWATLVFVLCALPSSAFPDIRLFAFPHADKVVHLFLFFVMSFLLRAGISARTGCNLARATLITILACITYGGIIEILQGALFHRGAEWLDLLADTIGAIAGSLASIAMARLRAKKKNPRR